MTAANVGTSKGNSGNGSPPLSLAFLLGTQTTGYQMLAEVAELDEQVVQSAIEAAVREQLVEEDPQSFGRYRYRHALTQEAIYGEIVLPRRQQIHSRAADFLQKNAPGALFDAAHHLLGAGRYDEAIPICIAGGDQALRTYALREAVKLYEHALRHITDDRLRGEVLCKIGEALWRNGEARAAEDHLEEGVSLLESLGEERLAAPFILTRGRCKWERARPDLAAVDYERARATLEPQGASGDLAAAYVRIAGLHAFQLDDESCLEAATKAVDIATDAGADDVYAWALGFVGLELIGVGAIDEGMKTMVDAYEAGKRVDYGIASNIAWNELWTRVHLMVPGMDEALSRVEDVNRGQLGVPGTRLARGYVRRSVGDLLGAYEDALDAYNALQQLNSVKMAWRGALLAAEVLAEMGRYEEAARYLPESSSRTEVQDLIYDCGARVRYHLGTGDPEGAVAEAEEILKEREALSRYAVVLARGVEAFVAVGRLDDGAGARDRDRGRFRRSWNACRGREPQRVGRYDESRGPSAGRRRSQRDLAHRRSVPPRGPTAGRARARPLAARASSQGAGPARDGPPTALAPPRRRPDTPWRSQAAHRRDLPRRPITGWPLRKSPSASTRWRVTVTTRSACAPSGVS